MTSPFAVNVRTSTTSSQSLTRTKNVRNWFGRKESSFHIFLLCSCPKDSLLIPDKGRKSVPLHWWPLIIMAINLYKHIYRYLAAIRESVSNPPWTHLAPSSTVSLFSSVQSPVLWMYLWSSSSFSSSSNIISRVCYKYNSTDHLCWDRYIIYTQDQSPWVCPSVAGHSDSGRDFKRHGPTKSWIRQKVPRTERTRREYLIKSKFKISAITAGDLFFIVWLSEDGDHGQTFAGWPFSWGLITLKYPHLLF